MHLNGYETDLPVLNCNSFQNRGQTFSCAAGRKPLKENNPAAAGCSGLYRLRAKKNDFGVFSALPVELPPHGMADRIRTGNLSFRRRSNRNLHYGSFLSFDTDIQWISVYMMHKVRLELTSPCGHRILSPARIPIPPFVQIVRLEGVEPTAFGLRIRCSAN